VVRNVTAEELKGFVEQIYTRLGVRPDEAQLEADLLVTADLRGVESHGVGSLPFRLSYVRGGLVNLAAKITKVQETPASVLLDADNGFGSAAGNSAMQICIEKAKGIGVSIAAVRRSSHYGIAAYYAMQALRHDMIGVSLTNSTPLVVPTFGREAMLGTNPICLAAPAGREYPFVLDMATSVVAAGKVSKYGRMGKAIPPGWAINRQTEDMTDPSAVTSMLYSFTGGGLLPLGGMGEEFGGHKGFGLSLMVDILTGVLSGSAYGPFPYRTRNGKTGPGNVGHFFAAISVEAFRPLDEFKMAMDELIDLLKESPRVKGQSRIYIHGEKEFECEKRRMKEGIPLDEEVASALETIGKELEVPFPS
jgi:LDH2 family malate/lactate/ureidoglycolate dehydrogenase